MYIIKQQLPSSTLPKQGEEVSWFANSVIHTGVLRGYDSASKPSIINEFGNPDNTNDMYSIRPKHPNGRIEPNWTRIPEFGKIITPDEDLNNLILLKLAERIPPGPSYLELINEMYQRGYETYLVGGTVRDFIQGVQSNDIDIVTTMPLKSSLSLIRSMFFTNFSANLSNGFIRVGGSPGTAEPFIDIKNFWSGIGGDAKIYGSEILNDYIARDFTCNSIYYDPINCQIIDPSGSGYEDARGRNLTIVKELCLSPHKINAQILIRFVKFCNRDYYYSTATLIRIKEEIAPLFSTMNPGERIDYISRQIINKAPLGKHQEHYRLFVDKMIALGLEEIYVKLIQPYEHLINI